mgnify:FL=1|jgi:hypothetical protein
MIEYLLYANLNCADTADMIRRIHKHEDLSDGIKVELVATVKEATPECKWDAND